MGQFTTEECEWSRTSFKVLGAEVIGRLKFAFDIDIEKEHLYAGGSKPIDIQSGNEKPTGSIEILKFELDKLNAAAQAAGWPTIAHVPHQLIGITCIFKKFATSPRKTITAKGVAFSKVSIEMAQNAKQTNCPLPFLAMDIVLD